MSRAVCAKGITPGTLQDMSTTHVHIARVADYPGSVAYLAQQGDIIIEDRPGVETVRLSSFAQAVRRASKKVNCPVHVEKTGSGSLRVRKAAA